MSKVNQLQVLQQNMQNLAVQKQQVESQLTELNSALKEVEGAERTYKIIGKIMVTSDKEAMKKDLQEKKEVADLHLKNFSKQEEQLKEKMDKLQQEAMQELKDESKGSD